MFRFKFEFYQIKNLSQKIKLFRKNWTYVNQTYHDDDDDDDNELRNTLNIIIFFNPYQVKIGGNSIKFNSFQYF